MNTCQVCQRPSLEKTSHEKTAIKTGHNIKRFSIQFEAYTCSNCGYVNLSTESLEQIKESYKNLLYIHCDDSSNIVVLNQSPKV